MCDIAHNMNYLHLVERSICMQNNLLSIQNRCMVTNSKEELLRLRKIVLFLVLQHLVGEISFSYFHGEKWYINHRQVCPSNPCWNDGKMEIYHHLFLTWMIMWMRFLYVLTRYDIRHKRNIMSYRCPNRDETADMLLFTMNYAVATLKECCGIH